MKVVHVLLQFIKQHPSRAYMNFKNSLCENNNLHILRHHSIYHKWFSNTGQGPLAEAGVENRYKKTYSKAYGKRGHQNSLAYLTCQKKGPEERFVISKYEGKKKRNKQLF